MFFTIIFQKLFLVDLPKSAGGIFFFVTYYFGIWWSEGDDGVQ